MDKQSQKRNIIYIEVLRILACFLVIFNHTPGYHLFLNEPESPKFFFHLAVSVFTRINNLVFFMISGGLLLGKSESIGDIWKKRISKTVILLLGGSIMVYGVNFLKGEEVSFVGFAKGLLANNLPGTTPYWFLYRYISVLIILPFIRPAVHMLTERAYIYLLLFRVFFTTAYGITQAIDPTLSITANLSPVLLDNAIFFFLMGYWLIQVFDITRLSKGRWLILVGTIIISIVMGMNIIIYYGRIEGISQGHMDVFTYIIAISVVLLVRYCFSRFELSDASSRGIAYFGRLTLGVYILDPVLKPIIEHVYNTPVKMGLFKGSFVYCFISMIIGASITAVAQWIPGIKKLL